MKPLARALAGAITVLLVAGVGYGGSGMALGAWDDNYRIEVVVGELGQGIVAGTDVKMRGVIVGEVGGIRLDDDLSAVVELLLDEPFRVPRDASFQVTGKTLLGEKQVEIVFDGRVEDGPFLADGTIVSDESRVVEFEDVLASLARLTQAIDPDDLGVVVDDFLGAFDGTGPAIAQSVDQGARATEVFRRSLDDQVANTRDLGLVVEALGEVGDDFNRLGASVVEGLPTLSENQQEIVGLLDELRMFSRTLNATFTVNRPDLDRMIIEGDNVVRLLFDYRPQVGELVSGLVSYTAKYGPGYRHPSIRGHAARFQILLTDDQLEAQICGVLPRQLVETIPACEPYVDTDPNEPEDPPGGPGPPPLPGPPGTIPGLSGDAGQPGLTLSLPRALTHPDVPDRLGVDTVARRTLPGSAQGASR